MAQHSPEHGTLDGRTILRFAHAFKTGGGVERHLADLNRQLSLRNALTTVQLHLAREPNVPRQEEERIGRSRLIAVPLAVERAGREATSAAASRGMRERALDCVVRTPSLNRLFGRGLLRWRSIPRRRHEPLGAGRRVAELLQQFKIDLVVLHTSGGADASEVIAAARQAGTPIALIHHFSNWRLGTVSVRQQACHVSAVGGASAVGVPSYLSDRYYNLSDAVDLEFYRRARARPILAAPRSPVIFAPGRVTPKKGQLDVLRVAARLAREGIHANVVFAGRVDSPDFDRQLRAAVAEAGISAHFAGELSLEQYRDWFAVADVMLMPTYHDEGMPRTLIDSQAMEVPPIVYDIGGTSEGLRPNESGFLVRLGDIDGMAEATSQLLRDPARAARMAAAGRRFVETQFSLDAFAARHEQFYLDTMVR